eukprot:Gb_20821 [translate_table: standard]
MPFGFRSCLLRLPPGELRRTVASPLVNLPSRTCTLPTVANSAFLQHSKLPFRGDYGQSQTTRPSGDVQRAPTAHLPFGVLHLRLRFTGVSRLGLRLFYLSWCLPAPRVCR